MNNLKKIIFSILLIIIIIIIIMTLMIFFGKKENNKDGNLDNIEDGAEIKPEEDTNGFVDVSDFSIGCSVIDSLKKCIENIKNNENVSIDDEEVDTESNLEVIYDLLDKNYINNNKINLNNIKSYIYEIDENAVLIPMQMKVRYEENINTYILRAYLAGNSVQERYFIIRIDNKNQTFSIELINEEISDIEKLKVEKNDNSIEKNDYNNFDVEIVNDGRMMQQYLEHYRNLIINCPEVAYNDYLDDKYKEKRFGSIDNFKKYINDNIDEISSIGATKYLVEQNDNDITYVCLDQYNNTYSFEISTIFNYKIKLDTYTLTSEKFITTYNNSDNKDKVMMNIDKFVMMLNSRDYDSAYKLLDESFRNNNFGTEEDFEQYIKNNCPSHYDVEYESFEQKGNDIFTQKISLSSINNKNSNDVKLNIVMKLEEGTNYVISFSIE